MCLALGIDGNLSKKIQGLNPETKFDKKQLVWLSNFQVDCKNSEFELRTFIRQSFKVRKK